MTVAVTRTRTRTKTARGIAVIQNTNLSWRVTNKALYLVLGRKAYRSKQCQIIANGTRDLCITQEGEALKIRKIRDCKPQDILLIPQNDLLSIEFEKELPPPFIGRYLVLEIEEPMVPLVTAALARFGGKKGDLYDAYLGREYVRV